MNRTAKRIAIVPAMISPEYFVYLTLHLSPNVVNRRRWLDSVLHRQGRDLADLAHVPVFRARVCIELLSFESGE
jgi:hypothetical protein